MQDTLTAAERWRCPGFPVAVVVSDLNRKGLTSLVVQEMGADPRRWLFESIEEAALAVDKNVKGAEPAEKWTA